MMIKRYGENADFEVCWGADELSETGDWAGMRVWLRIHEAVDALKRGRLGKTRNLTVCNLYSITKGPKAIRDHARATRDKPGASREVIGVHFADPCW